MPDWLKRSLKTFLQAFIPVILAEHTAIVNKVLTLDWSAVWAYVLPVLISAVAAGICALWNLALEKISKEGDKN